MLTAFRLNVRAGCPSPVASRVNVPSSSATCMPGYRSFANVLTELNRLETPYYGRPWFSIAPPTGTDPVVLRNLRDDGIKLVQTGDSHHFLTHVFHTIDQLESLQGDNITRFSLPPELMFVGPKSPAHGLIRTIMGKAFEKARSFFGSVHNPSNQNNHSGYALAGPRGVGKSNVLQLCAILSGLLLPNAIPVYFDSGSVAAVRDSSTDPLTLLREALQLAGVEPSEVPSAALNLQLAHAAGRCVLVFADEVGHLYQTPSWRYLHDLATDMKAGLFVADSSTRLRSMICADRKRLIALGLPVFESLNSNKLSLRRLGGMNSIEQYQIYLRRRVPSFRTNEDSLRGLHSISDGRYRDISRFLLDPADDSVGDLVRRMPSPGSPLHVIFQQLVQKESNLTDSPYFDPFRPPSLTECELMKELESRDCGLQDLAMWCDENMLRLNEDGSYTFGHPLFYYLARNMHPRVFISHACGDYEDIRFFVQTLRSAGVHVQVCEDPDALRSQHDKSLGEWMSSQIEFKNDFVVVVLSERYVERAASPDSGCSREISLLNSDDCRTLRTQGRVLFARIDHTVRLNAYPRSADAYTYNLQSPNDLAGLISAIFGTPVNRPFPSVRG